MKSDDAALIFGGSAGETVTHRLWDLVIRVNADAAHDHLV